jgi:hypothetical protein
MARPDEQKICRECGAPMTFDKRPFPEGVDAAAVGEDRWICTNPKCNTVEIAD